MKTIVIKDRRPIPLGRVGENEVTEIKFCIAAFFPGLSGALYELVHKLPNGFTYIVRDRDDGRVRDGFVNWVVKDSDLGTSAGTGVAQLTAFVNNKVYKTVVFTTQIENGLGVGPAPASPEKPWVTKVFEEGELVSKSLEEAQAAAKNSELSAALAVEAASAVPTTVDNALEAAKASGDFDGADGYSPTVTVTDIEGGHLVTITDVNGPHTFEVMDGEGGSSGTNNYNDLTNKPKINGYTLSGNRTAVGLDLAQILWVDDETTVEEVYDAWIDGRVIARKDSGKVYSLTYRYEQSGTVYYVFTYPDEYGAYWTWKLDSSGNWDTPTQYALPQGAVTGTPAMDGTAARGTSWYYAHADHVHPVDTSRAPAAAGVPLGGTKGYSLKKKSSSDLDVEWQPNAFDLLVSTNSTTHVATSATSPATLIEKLNSCVVNCYVTIDGYEGVIYFQNLEYLVSEGVTYWTFRFVGLVLDDTHTQPAVAVVEFPTQAQSAASLVGTGYAYPLQLST